MEHLLQKKMTPQTQVPLLDLKVQYQTLRGEIDAAVKEVLESQICIMGPQVTVCEEKIAAYSSAQFGIGVSSGTDALLACLMAENIQPGDEVITTPYTFFATAGSIARLGAKPVFVDIDPVSFNMRTDQIEAKITPKTKAIMPVHLYGQMADMNPILQTAKKNRLIIIEDACQAIGATYQGKKAGSLGDYGCFSFFPSKNLGGAGDGGMIVTSSEEKAERLRVLRNHGAKPKYYHSLIGGNFRLDTLQAAIVTVKLKHLDTWTEKRKANALRYHHLFEESGVLKSQKVQLPKIVFAGHIFNQYVIRVQKRDELRAYLKNNLIDTEVYYPVPLHLQECFRYLGHKEGDFPESEKAAKETLALPIFPELSQAQAAWVVKCITDFYKKV